MENKYVYWDNRNYCYKEIPEEFIDDAKNYFGDIDYHLDNNDEMIFYKLVPYKTLKKKINYELE